VQVGASRLCENPLKPHKASPPGRVPHVRLNVRLSVHGLNKMAKQSQALIPSGTRLQMSESIRKRSYLAHVRLGEHGAPVPGVKVLVA
jgi:hypothetical protein